MLGVLEKRLHSEASRPLNTQRQLDAERKEVTQIDRLYDAVAKGIIPLDTILQEKVQQLKARHDEILIERARIEGKKELSLRKINSTHIEAFCSALKQKIRDSASHFGREYLRLLLDEIVVDGKEVIVRGQYNNLIDAITKKLDTPLRSAQFWT